MQQQLCHSLPCARWEKSHLYSGLTSPKRASRSRESRGTNAKSHVVSGPTLRHGPRGCAVSRREKHQRWVEQQSSKWVWPSFCKGRRGVRQDGTPGEEQGPCISGGSGCLGVTAYGGACGAASKLHTCMRLPNKFECLQHGGLAGTRPFTLTPPPSPPPPPSLEIGWKVPDHGCQRRPREILLELAEGEKMGFHPMCLYSKYSVF